MMKPQRGKTPRKTPAKKRNSGPKDEVYVFARVKPVPENAERCCETVNASVLRVFSPESTGKHAPLDCQFKRVFPESYGQKIVFDNTAFPLVCDLVEGKNGLLFTYGVTGSGKTYTMTGSSQDAGMLPRTVDVLFNTIRSLQAPAFVIRPDGQNGYDVLDPEKARDLERAAAKKQNSAGTLPKTPRTARKRLSPDTNFSDNNRVKDPSSVPKALNTDMVYAVFVSMVEIYNNQVFDLLEEDRGINQKPANKMVREDIFKSTYVSGLTEVEVKTPDDAFDVFQTGINKRKVANTVLNADSSRSHSIFTIRLVAAPIDQFENIINDKYRLVVSQLSLVDLAGSERAKRTHNTGDRIKEAGRINNSLMKLRQCFEVIRDNQKNNTDRPVPYRDERLTFLFKNYFEGEGKIRMIVCVNPIAEEYDETLNVMQFAVMTSEVAITQRDKMDKVRFALESHYGGASKRKPGASAAAKWREAALAQRNHTGPYERFKMFEPWESFPNMELKNPEDDLIMQGVEYLQKRETKAVEFTNYLNNQQLAFRDRLKSIENDLADSYQAVEERDKALAEVEVLKAENRDLKRKLSDASRHENALVYDKQALHEKTKRMKKDHDEMQQKMMLKDQKWQLLKDVVVSGSPASSQPAAGRRPRGGGSDSGYSKTTVKTTTKVTVDDALVVTEPDDVDMQEPPPSSSPTEMGTPGQVNARRQQFEVGCTPPSRFPSQMVPMANVRHRRSRSVGSKDAWVEHNPKNLVDTGTVYGPKYTSRRKSVTDLRQEDVDARQVNKYALRHQVSTKEGGVDTHLFKGDVHPTAGGGSAVVFHGVETLTQTSPTEV